MHALVDNQPYYNPNLIPSKTNTNINMEKSTLPIFHFIFCELIEECYSNYKEDDYKERLKVIGSEIGFRLYNQIAIKKYINERSLTASSLVKIVQNKVFKYIFGYEASSTYTATEDKS